MCRSLPPGWAIAQMVAEEHAKHWQLTVQVASINPKVLVMIEETQT
jgi:hypothetical protein